MKPYYTERFLHEEAAQMGIDPALSRYTRLFPDGEPVARWEITGMNPLQLDLYPIGRKKQSIASVYHTTAWHTWDEDGIGGANGGEEVDIDTAIIEAFKACLQQGFL